MKVFELTESKQMIVEGEKLDQFKAFADKLIQKGEKATPTNSPEEPTAGPDDGTRGDQAGQTPNAEQPTAGPDDGTRGNQTPSANNTQYGNLINGPQGFQLWDKTNVKWIKIPMQIASKGKDAAIEYAKGQAQ